MKNTIVLLVAIITQFPVFSQNKTIKIQGEAQGTTYHITYLDKKKRDFKPKIDRILSDFDLSVSTYIPNSIISKINSNQKDVQLDRYFITCFNKAKEVWKNTNGAFDPTVYPLVNVWGFGPGKKEKVERKKIDSILQFIGFDLIEIRNNKIVKKDSRVSLDFNAFAQGYSVDVVAQFLDSKGIHNYVVEIGGEVYAKGKKEDNSNWTIGIEKPIDNKLSPNPLKALVKLQNLAVASSGNYRRFIIEDGIKYAHHIDPKTGYPAKNNLLSASVFSKECITSDSNATGILVMGLEKAKEFLEKHSELDAYLIYSDENGNYQTYETSGIKNILIEIEN